MDDVVQPKGLDRLFGSLKHKYGAAGNTTSSGQSSFTRSHREDITGPIPVPELPAAAGFTVHSNDFFQTTRRTTGECSHRKIPPLPGGSQRATVAGVHVPLQETHGCS